MADQTPSGIAALRESNTRFAQKVTTSAMENALRNSYTRMGVEPEVWDGIHTSLDLAVELKVARANVIRFSAMLAAGEQHIVAPSGVAISVEVLLQQSLMVVRQLVKTQHEVAPGVERAGDIRLTIKVDGGVPTDAQASLIPDLTDDSEDLPPIPGMDDDAVAPALDPQLDPTGYGDDE